MKNKVIAVCEKGESPYIVVHQWPNYNIISVFESVFQEKEYIYSSLRYLTKCFLLKLLLDIALLVEIFYEIIGEIW